MNSDKAIKIGDMFKSKKTGNVVIVTKLESYWAYLHTITESNPRVGFFHAADSCLKRDGSKRVVIVNWLHDPNRWTKI